MTVSTITSVAANIVSTTGSQDSRAASALRDLVAATPASAVGSVSSASGDQATFPTAAVLQNQVASLRAATQSLASAGSMLQTAQGGTSELAGVLGQLQDLAARANDSSLSLSERTQLNSQAAAIRAQINQINATTTFNGEPLLTGAAKQLQISQYNETSSPAIGSLTEESLLGGASLDLTTTEGAQTASQLLQKAQSYVATQSSALSSLQAGVLQASATVETALQNNAAAGSTLSEADLSGLAAASESDVPQARLLAQTAAAQSAQANRLPAGVLQLLAE